MARPSKAMPSLNRAAIVAKSLEILEEKGPQVLSFRALAREFSVTPMAITHHVGSREDLMAQMIHLAFKEVATGFTAETARSQIRLLLERYCRRLLAYPQLALCLFASSSHLPEDLAGLTARIENCLSELIPQSDVERLLHLLVDYTHGFALAASHALNSGAAEVPKIEGFTAGLDWIISRLDGEG